MSVTPMMIAVALGQAAPVSSSITEQQWGMWIDDAVMLIDNRIASLEPVTAPSAAAVDYVVREAVVAQVKKPDDATQVTISVDDSSSSRTYQSGKGRVTILDEWWLLLGLVEVQGGAFSIDTTNFASGHLAWCSYNMGALYCSCGFDIAGFPLWEA
jgi:hypothetical protein